MAVYKEGEKLGHRQAPYLLKYSYRLENIAWNIQKDDGHVNHVHPSESKPYRRKEKYI